MPTNAFRVHFAGTCHVTLWVHVPAAHQRQREPVRTWHLRPLESAFATVTVATACPPPSPGAQPTNEHRPRRHPHPPPHALRLLPHSPSSAPLSPFRRVSLLLSMPIYKPPPRHALPTATATPPAPNQWRTPPPPRTPTCRPHLRRRSSRLLAARTSGFSRGGTDRL